MSAFDKIIGYETVKNELLKICDTFHNPHVYENLGAKTPRGLLLYGDVGIGKTLMAKCFIEESGLVSYTVRRNKTRENFIEELTSTFRKAKENAPSIVFLDDMDKFANEDEECRDAEEYVAIQSCIDETKDFGVFVLASANNIFKLPDSLIRPGRFDRKIEVCAPSPADACEIVKHYLKDKKIDKNMNLEDVAMMVQYRSCAELETILNEGALLSAYARRDSISIDDITNALISMEYDSPDSFVRPTSEDLAKIALHEAGHLTVCEALCPDSVGLVSLKTSGRGSSGGFVRRCKDLSNSHYDILVSLAGKAACELYYPEKFANGCQRDIKRAFRQIRSEISESASLGFGMLDVSTHLFPDVSESFNSRNEAVVHAELERFYMKTRHILQSNRPFLENAARLLREKETLLYSDIKKLKENFPLTLAYL